VDQSRRRPGEYRQVACRVLVEIGEIKPGERPVLLLAHEQCVEDADDPTVDEVQQDRHRFAGHRGVGG